MMLPSRLGCPLSLKTPNMGNIGLLQPDDVVEVANTCFGIQTLLEVVVTPFVACHNHDTPNLVSCLVIVRSPYAVTPLSIA